MPTGNRGWHDLVQVLACVSQPVMQPVRLADCARRIALASAAPEPTKLAIVSRQTIEFLIPDLPYRGSISGGSCSLCTGLATGLGDHGLKERPGVARCSFVWFQTDPVSEL